MILTGELIQAVEAIVKQAGTIVLTYFGKPLERKEKKDAGFVTIADLESERYLMAALQQLLPQASFFAEESGKNGDAPYCWVIDPLDGTTNFAHQIPYFCISVALTYEGTPVLGIVYDPLRDELFCAQRDKPTLCNGKPVAVNQPENLNQALILVGVPYQKGEAYVQTIETVKRLSAQIVDFRHLGAIALEQAYVACGRADGIFFRRLGWWDIAAGLLLIKQAGGKVSTFQGTMLTQNYRSFVGGHPEIHAKLRLLLPTDT
jgi:myo-inositol-1(or 4)-monophosphatase